MSADNTIVILETHGKYRVAHIQAAENIEYYWNDDRDSLDEYLITMFGKSKVHDLIFDSWSEAQDIEEKLYLDGLFVEYGIEEISLDMDFPEVAQLSESKSL